MRSSDRIRSVPQRQVLLNLKDFKELHSDLLVRCMHLWQCGRADQHAAEKDGVNEGRKAGGAQSPGKSPPGPVVSSFVQNRFGWERLPSKFLDFRGLTPLQRGDKLCCDG